MYKNIIKLNFRYVADTYQSDYHNQVAANDFHYVIWIFSTIVHLLYGVDYSQVMSCLV